MKRILAILALGLSIGSLQTGCTTTASEQRVTYQTLATVGQGAKAGINVAAQLLANGSISVARYQEVADFYDKKFQPAYALAVAVAQADLSTLASPDVQKLAEDFAVLISKLSTK